MRRALVVLIVAGAIASPAVAAPSTTVVPRDDVAVVAGHVITATTWRHWIMISVKGNSSSTVRGPEIVPVQPPKFATCVAQVRHQIPSLRHTSRRRIVRDCAQLFGSLNGQVLDYLIKARWYLDDALRLGISFSPAQISKTITLDRMRQFKTIGAYHRFLRQTGQTNADVRFRVLADLVDEALIKRDHTAAAVDRQVTGLYRSQTVCARLYRMADCS